MAITETPSESISVPKSDFHRVSANFTWTFMSETITKGLLFLSNVFLARKLGTENFGVFVLAQSITSFLWLAADMGINLYGTREIARNKKDAQRIINPILTIRLTAGIIIFIVYILVLFIFDIKNNNRVAFAGCGLFLLTYSLYTDWVLRGLEQFKLIAYGSIASSFSFIIGIILFVKSETVGIAAIIWSLSYLMGCLSLLYALKTKSGIVYTPSFNVREWSSHIKESKFFMFSGILILIYQLLPVYALGIFFNYMEIGIFSAPYRIIMTIGSAGILLTSAFFPIFSDLHKHDQIKFRSIHKKFQLIMLGIGLSIALIGTVFDNEIIALLFGQKYTYSVPIFRLLIWLIPLYFLRYTFGSVLFAAGLQRVHNYICVFGVLCLVVVGLILVPGGTITDIAKTLLISELLFLSSMAVGTILSIKYPHASHY